MRAVRGALALVVLAAVVFGLWTFRAPLLAVIGVGAGEEPTEVSAEAAAHAEAKLDRLREDGEPARLSDIEMASLLRYRYGGSVPDLLREPDVRFSGDTVQLTGRVALDALPSMAALDAARALLPDTAKVEIEGRLQPMQGGRAAFVVRQVEVAGLPVPDRYYPPVLERMGRRDEPGLEPNALAFRLPAGVGAARVEGGALILNP